MVKPVQKLRKSAHLCLDAKLRFKVMLNNRTRFAGHQLFIPFLFLVLCLFPALLFAQINWKPLGGPTSPGNVWDLAISPSGAYFLLNGRAIFRSQDAGASWQELADPDPTYVPEWDGLDVLPDGTMVANRGARIYRMPPGSSQISLVYEHHQPSFLRQLRHTPAGMLLAWDVNTHAIFKSVDQGSSWQSLYTTSIQDLRSFSVNGNGKNFLSDHSFYIQFEEDGSKQKTIYYPPNTPIFEGTQNVVYLEDKGILMRSSLFHVWTSPDEGSSWDSLPLPTTAQTLVSGMAYDSMNSRLLVGLGDTIWTTSNLGFDWTVFLVTPKNPTPYFNIVIDNKGNMLLRTAACDPDILLRSKNSGQTWTATEHLFKEIPTNKIIRDHAGHLYASALYSCWKRSVDGGQSWENLRAAPGELSFAKMLLTREGILFGEDMNGQIFRSSDHGASWQTTGPLSWGDRELYEGGDGAIYVVSMGTNEAYVSDNLGKSWSSLGIMTGRFFAPHPDGSIYWMNAPSSFSHIQRSVDHGLTWSELPVALPASLNSDSRLFCSSTGVFYIYNATQVPIVFSTDGFATWKTIDGPQMNELTSDAVGNLFGVSPYAHELFYLNAATQTWQALNTPLDGRLLACAIDRDQKLLIGGTYGDLYDSDSSFNSIGVLRGQVQVLPDCSAPNLNPQPGWLVQAENTSNTFVTASSITDSIFRFFIPAGNYQISTVVQSPFYPACSPPQIVAVPAPDTIQSRIATSNVSCPYLRVVSVNPFLRRCFENDYTISWCNEGNAVAANAWLEVTLDPFFEFVSASLPATTVGTNLLRFDLDTLAPGSCGSLKLRVKVSCDADLGQIHCFQSHIFPDTLCLPGLDTAGIYQECAENRGAFDPNDKTAFVNGREESKQYPADAALEFLVRFQNTGTDTAFRVVVEDRLSRLLDAGTFRPLIASHPYRWEMQPDWNTGEHVVRFIFDPVGLPDSTTNEAASHGFVKFAIRPKSPVSPAALLENFADIFFDYNPAVRTNTIQLSYTSSVHTVPSIPSAKISPQPFHDFARIEFDYTGECRFQLFDSQGKLLQQDQAKGGRYIVQRGQLPSGVYFCRFVSEGEGIVASARLVIE